MATSSRHYALNMHREMTKGNWSDPGPVMDYVFLNMAEFFPHALIHRNGDITPLPQSTNRPLDDVRVETDCGEMTLDDYLEQGTVNGVVAVHEGEIAYERYPGMVPYEKHLLMSVSKIFASTLVALLEDRGELDTNNPIDQYLPDLGASGWEGVSVRDVLDMCSGIDCLESDVEGAYSDPTTGYYHYEASLGWLAATDATMASTYTYVTTLRQGRQPGEAFEYTSLNTFVLSWLVEEITGKPYATAITDELWAKIGAESDALVSVSSVNAPASHGGISATLRDIARLGMLFTPSRKRLPGSDIVSERYLREIQQGGRPEIFDKAAAGRGMIERLRGERPIHNSCQWDLVLDDGDFFKGGYGGQGLYISPSRDLVIAFFGTPTHDSRGSDMLYISRQLATSGALDR